MINSQIDLIQLLNSSHDLVTVYRVKVLHDLEHSTHDFTCYPQ